MKVWLVVMIVSLALCAQACGSDGGGSGAAAGSGGDAGSSGGDAGSPGVDVGSPGGDAPAPGVDDSGPVDLPDLGLSSFTLEHGGMTREYIVYVPASYDGVADVPLFINFHGNGGSASYFQSETAMTGLADEENFLLVYPQGTDLDGTSHWNPLPLGGDNKSPTDDLGFVDALLDALIEAYRVDEDRVYACGYSNGGFMAYGLACNASDRFTAIGSVSGTLLGGVESCAPTHPTPVISLNGTSDFVVPYDGGPGYPSSDEVLDYWTDFNGITGDPTITNLEDGGMAIERTLYEGGQNGSAVCRYKLTGGDHVWFDLDIEGADTGRLVWDFVSQYDLSTLRQP